jgi:hypothetical protein
VESAPCDLFREDGAVHDQDAETMSQYAGDQKRLQAGEAVRQFQRENNSGKQQGHHAGEYRPHDEHGREHATRCAGAESDGSDRELYDKQGDGGKG